MCGVSPSSGWSRSQAAGSALTSTTPTGVRRPGEHRLRATPPRGSAAHEPLVVLLDEQRPGEADEGGVVGVDADHVAAARRSRGSRAPGGWSSAASSSARRGKAMKASSSSSAASSSSAPPWAPLAPGPATTPAEPLARLGGVLGGEDLADGRRDHRLLALRAVAEHVAEEVHGAALPGAAEHLGDRASSGPRGRRRRRAARRPGRGPAGSAGTRARRPRSRPRRRRCR